MISQRKLDTLRGSPNKQISTGDTTWEVGVNNHESGSTPYEGSATFAGLDASMMRDPILCILAHVAIALRGNSSNELLAVAHKLSAL